MNCRAVVTIAVAMLAGCSPATGGGTMPSPVSAQSASAKSGIDAVLDSAPEANGGSMIFRKMAMHPDAKAPAWLMNFVAAGPNQGGVPCIGCVNGASTSYSVGMTGPTNYVAANFVWQYEISFTDVTYKGSCKLAWAITSGKTTIDSFSKTLKLTSSGGFVFYAISRSRPKYSGPATLTGKVTCGKASQSSQAPLQFE